MFICSHCGKVTSTSIWKRPGNADAWAVGEQRSNGFHIRRVVWGLLMAQAEKRMDEEIRKASIMVEAQHKYRQNQLPELKHDGETT